MVVGLISVPGGDLCYLNGWVRWVGWGEWGALSATAYGENEVFTVAPVAPVFPVPPPKQFFQKVVKGFP